VIAATGFTTGLQPLVGAPRRPRPAATAPSPRPPTPFVSPRLHFVGIKAELSGLLREIGLEARTAAMLSINEKSANVKPVAASEWPGSRAPNVAQGQGWGEIDPGLQRRQREAGPVLAALRESVSGSSSDMDLLALRAVNRRLPKPMAAQPGSSGAWDVHRTCLVDTFGAS
jgi:hypothetical protein